MEAYKKLCLSGKVAVITGSTAGIGQATAELMASRGAKVTLHGRRQDRLDMLAQQFENKFGFKPHTVLGDIEDPEVQDELVNGTVQRFGRLDVLINNAGWMLPGSIDSIESDGVRKMIECHVVAPFQITQKALPELIKSTGNVIMVSSACSQRGYTGACAYATAKAAMDNMMRCLCGDLAPKGIRVNCVNPGLTQTEIFRTDEMQSHIKEKFCDEVAPQTALKKYSTSEDIAEMIAFVASDAASMVSGTTQIVDGGASAVML